MFELAYSCGLRSRRSRGSIWTPSTSRPSRSGCAARVGRSGQLPVGEPAQRALQQYLETARPALLVGSPERKALLLSRRGRRLSASDVRRRLRRWVRDARLAPESRRIRCATPSPPICSRAALFYLRSIQELLGHGPSRLRRSIRG